MQGLCQCNILPSRRYGAFLVANLHRLPQRPQQAFRGCRHRSQWQVRAEGENSKEPEPLDVQKIGTIPFLTDTETIEEVMAFAGCLPEVGGVI